MAFRIYIDTSVIGGCGDSEFAEESLRLFDLVRQGRLVLLISDVLIQELADDPLNIRKIFEGLSESMVETVPLSEAVLQLRDAYLAADVVGRKWMDDATHVAAATIAGADAIVSWNFKHIVRLDKIRAYNEVNRAMGLGALTIVSPKEVVYDNADDN
jgi:hypothetical protein